MSFKAIVECDGFACCNEIDIHCHEPAEAEDAVFDIADKGWLIDGSNNHHYCPVHAPAAREELEAEQRAYLSANGIRPTMVG